jgi:hypothetical protein
MGVQRAGHWKVAPLSDDPGVSLTAIATLRGARPDEAPPLQDPHPSPGRELNLDRTAASGGRRQRLPVGRNGDCRKTDFAILPLHRLGSESEDACARLPPPGRNQIAVNVMSPSNLDNTGSRRQTLLHDPKLLGTRPPPSPLWTGQNRNRRHVCSFACELMSKSSHARTRSGKAVSTGGLLGAGALPCCFHASRPLVRCSDLSDYGNSAPSVEVRNPLSALDCTVAAILPTKRNPISYPLDTFIIRVIGGVHQRLISFNCPQERLHINARYAHFCKGFRHT